MKGKRNVTKRITAWLTCLAMTLTTFNLPAFTTEVMAADLELSVTKFATVEQLKSADNFTLHKSNGNGIAQKINFGSKIDNGTKVPMQWYIAGTQGNQLVLIHDVMQPWGRKEFSSSVKEYEYGEDKLTVSSNHWGASDIRHTLLEKSQDTSAFSLTEQNLMQTVTIYTKDTRNDLIYETKDKLYLAYGAGSDTNSFTVGENSLKDLYGGIKIGFMEDNASPNSTFTTLHDWYTFWLREPSKNGYCKYVRLGRYISEASATGTVSANQLLPVFHLDLSDVLFASSASVVSEKASLSNPLTVRYRSTDQIGSSAAAGTCGIQVTKGDDVSDLYLYVQGNDGSDWVYSKKIEKNEILNPSQIKYGIDLTKCKIWLETEGVEQTENGEDVRSNVVYAKEINASSGHEFADGGVCKACGICKLVFDNGSHDFPSDGDRCTSCGLTKIKYTLDSNNMTAKVTGYNATPSGDLIIPDTVTIDGLEYSVTEIAAYAFNNGYNYDGKLSIGDNVKTIGKNAFYYCYKLTGDVILSDSLTVLGEKAFTGCTKLSVSAPCTVNDGVDKGVKYREHVKSDENCEYTDNSDDEKTHSYHCIVCDKDVSEKHSFIKTDIDTHTCEYCGALREHVLGDYIGDSDNGHYQVCSKCAGVTEVEPHTFVPTKGGSQHECSVCGYGIFDHHFVDGKVCQECGRCWSVQLNGKHSFVEKEGDSTNHVCSTCGLEEEHSYGAFDPIVGATHDTDGTKTRMCLVCNHMDTVTVKDSKNYVIEYIADKKYDTGETLITTYFDADLVRHEYDSVTKQGRLIFDEAVTRVFECAFMNSGVTNVILPDSVTVIEENVFNGCQLSEEFVLPANVRDIGEYAFENCNLKELVIPASVRYIGMGAFSGNDGLKVTLISKDFMSDIVLSDDSFVNATIFVPCSLLEEYKTDDVAWGYFANKTYPFHDFSDAATNCHMCYVCKAVAETGEHDFTKDPYFCSICETSNPMSLYDMVSPETDEEIDVHYYLIVNEDGTEENPKYTMVFTGTGEIPNGVLYDVSTFIEIPDKGNLDDKDITQIDIKEGITGIGMHAFDVNASHTFTRISIPNSVVSIKEAAFLFSAGSELTVVIPDSVTDLSSRAFEYADVKEISLPCYYGASYLEGLFAPVSKPRAHDFSVKIDDTVHKCSRCDATEAHKLTIKVNATTSQCESCGAQIIVVKPVEITKQPQSVNAAAGDMVTFTVEATGATAYKWQFSADGGKTWTNCTGTGYNTNTLSFSMLAKYAGRIYRCVTSNAAGNVISDGAELTVKTAASKPVITSQPVAVNAAAGETVRFSILATGATAYQWQYSSNGGSSWSNCSGTGYNTASLSFSMAAKYTGRLYRCVVSNAAGSVNSEAVALTIKTANKPVITTQPVAVNAAAGETVRFSIAATGATTYQWQYSSDGSKWSNCSGTGYNTANLSFSMAAKYTGRLYRCVVSNAAGSINSEAVALTIKTASKPVITTQPAAVNAAAGEKVTFSVTATGATTYQWQYSSDGSKWSNCSGTGYNTASLSFNMMAKYNGRQYRCVVTNASGSVNSTAVALTIKTANKPVINTQPAAVNAGAGETVTFSVAATGATSYQWQYSTDGSKWSNCSGTGYDTATLSFNMMAKYNGRLYRCVVKNAQGSVNSNTAALTLK